MKTLCEFVGRNTFGKPGAVDHLLVDYKAHLLKKAADGTFTENTANDKSKFARQFILWAWEHNVLKDPPRQLVYPA